MLAYVDTVLNNPPKNGLATVYLSTFLSFLQISPSAFAARDMPTMAEVRLNDGFEEPQLLTIYLSEPDRCRIGS